MKWQLLAVITGFILDVWLGDPHWLYHPVQAIGALISKTEKIVRRLLPVSPGWERAGGALMALFVLLTVFIAAESIRRLAYAVHPLAGFLIESLICYQMLALKSLKDESMKVWSALKNPDLKKARQAVSMIVGRDTEKLDRDGIIRAAVETVAENTSDGVIAPLFYMVLFGSLGGVIYKTVNTMDSMVGYTNSAYQYFGTAAAKLDDIMNLIPARLAAGFMILASYLLGFNGKQAIKIFKRDRYQHKSPNSAQTESVCAGALQIRLAGNAWYFGTLYEKPEIGDPIRQVEPDDIRRANQLLYGTALLFLFFFTGFMYFLTGGI